MTAEQKKLTFEKALEQLEKIVSDVEEGKIGLEQAIEKYEQGMKLIQHCRGILDSAEKRIETISKQSEAKEETAGE
jgi:exodeoxyribonuclease VII small subunit